MSRCGEPLRSDMTARRRTASFASRVDELVQQRPHAVDDARVVAREQLEREQRGAAAGRALVLEPAPQQLDLLAEAELRRSPGRRRRARGSPASARPPRAPRPTARAGRRARARRPPRRARRPRPQPRRASRLRQRVRRRADVARRRPDQAAGAPLLEDVRRPAGDARAAEHRRVHRGRDVGDRRARPPPRTRRSSRARGRATSRAAPRARPARAPRRPRPAASRARCAVRRSTRARGSSAR